MRRCGPGYASTPRSILAAGSGRRITTLARNAGWSITRRFNGFGVKRDCGAERRRRKRHGTSTAPDTVIADAPNRVWAVDFQFDVTTDGRTIKIVSIIDEHTRECLGGLVERSITGQDLIAELDRLAGQRGTYPTVLRCDNGPELACGAVAEWADSHVGLYLIPPGEPWRNG